MTNTRMTDTHDLLTLAHDLRRQLEPHWRAWKTEKGKPTDAPTSHGMCRFTTAYLLCALPAHGLRVRPRAKGGMADFHPADPGQLPRFDGRPGGFQDADGLWHDHTWLEVTLTEGSYILDLTADQFGAEPVLLVPAGDRRYRANWRDAAIRRHLEDVRARAIAWAAG